VAVSPLDDRILGALFGDAELGAVFDERRTVERWTAVEAALAEAAAAEGLAPEATAAAIRAAPAPAEAVLAAGTARDGLPIPAYVAALKLAVREPLRAGVHIGSTSQDILDTAQALALRDANDILAGRIAALDDALAGLAARFGDRPLMARTRMQAALPVTVGHRIAAWRAPLAGQAADLEALRPRVEALQFGGPVGTREGWSGRGDAVARRMAAALGLADPGRAWHTDRSAIGAYGALMAGLAASAGKIGADVALMAQQGLGEAAVAGGGSSSAMAHKANPILAELLVALARYAATLAGGLAQSLVHEQERSGAAWSLEMMLLPQLVVTAGRSLGAATELAGRIERLGESARERRAAEVPAP
jgi:3-carboxy-cis,cis-muconate cycloisomerase